MIVILNDSIRGRVSNEETLWSKLTENIESAKGISINSLEMPVNEKLDELKPDLILQNANLGKVSNYKTISFLQDPYIEMKKYNSFLIYLREKLRGRETYQDKLKKQKESLQNSICVTNSNYMAYLYKDIANFTVIPLGVDSDLFHPLEKIQMKKKYDIPKDKTIKIFVGSQHPIKGFQKIIEMINDEPSVFWILVLKDKPFPNGHKYKVFNKIPQKMLAELYNCADLCVSRSLTESFGLSLVEAMFCNVAVDTPRVGIFWDWQPSMKKPRQEVFEKKLDMKSCMENWQNFIKKN